MDTSLLVDCVGPSSVIEEYHWGARRDIDIQVLENTHPKFMSTSQKGYIPSSIPTSQPYIITSILLRKQQSNNNPRRLKHALPLHQRIKRLRHLLQALRGIRLRPYFTSLVSQQQQLSFRSIFNAKKKQLTNTRKCRLNSDIRLRLTRPIEPNAPTKLKHNMRILQHERITTEMAIQILSRERF